MRRRRSNVLLRRVIGCCLLLGIDRAAHAQTGIRPEGAFDFVRPTGARVLGMGQAGVATAFGAEALWWNPALIAHGPREADMGLVTGVITTDADVNLAFVYPIPHVISFGLSLRYVDLGEQEALDSTSTTTGTFRSSSDVLMGTVAAPFGDRLAIGLSLKMYALRFSKTGEVENAPSGSPITGAFDLGAQYIATKDSVFILGAALRNVGLPLQVNDAPQADPLPGRAEFGVQFKPRFPTYPDVDLRVVGDVITPLGGGGPGYRLGGEVSWEKMYHARAGYVVDGPTGSGPTIGVGASFARWRVDFAQFLNDLSTDGSNKPTYLSIRYAF